MASIVSELPGIAPVLPLPAERGSAVAGTNPVLSEAVSDSGPGMSTYTSEISASDFFHNDVLIAKQTIANTDSPTTPLLASVFDPFGLYFANTLVQSRLAGIRQFRADLIVTVVCVVPGACYGAYIVSAICEGGFAGDAQNLDGPGRDHYATSVQDEYAVVNCEFQNSAQLKLCFASPKESDLISSSNPEKMWRLRIYPVSPLQSSIAATAVGTLLIYARLAPGYSLETRVFQGRTSRDAFPVSEKTSSKISKVGGVMSRLGSSVPFLAPFTTPAAAGLAAISSIADIFGYTKEAAPSIPTTQVPRPFTNTLTVDGGDTSEPLALMSSNSVAIDGGVSDSLGEDQMSFASLFQRWTIVSRLEITTATSPGIIGRVQVSPFICTTVGSYSYFTVPGYVGLPFTYWSGSMEYMVYIPSNPSLKGTLQVFWTPIASSASFSQDPTPFLNGVMIDLSGTSKTLVSVPMAVPSPMRSVSPFSNTDVSYNPMTMNGTLVFYLSASLVAPRVGATLPILLLARGGSDMRFHLPSSLSPAAPVVGAPQRTLTEAYAFQGKSEIDPAVEEVFVDLNPSKARSDVSKVYIGEEVASVRALMQRFSYVGTARVDQEANGPFGFGVCYPPVVPGVGVLESTFPRLNLYPNYVNTPQLGVPGPRIARPWTWVSHYAVLYCGIRGGHRVKVAPDSVGYAPGQTDGPTRSVLAFAVDPGFASYLMNGASNRSTFESKTIKNYVSISPFSGCYPLDVQKSDGFWEVSVPYYGRWKYVYPRPAEGLYSTNTTGSIDNVGPQRTSASAFFYLPLSYSGYETRMAANVYVASGPDVGVGRFRRVPAILWTAPPTE